LAHCISAHDHEEDASKANPEALDIMALSESKIFVSIAAYRDLDAGNTLHDLFSKALHPEQLVVGLCWQFLPEEDEPFVDLPQYRTRIRQIALPARDSRGPCWARSRIQHLMQDEEYYFQIDSHMRFARHWDERLIQALYACQCPNPVLSTYPLPFTPPNDLAADGIVEIRPRCFDQNGILQQHSALHPMPAAPATPARSWFVSAGMLFAPARMVKEAPYDPHLYFHGEEISLAVRLWTHGWDIFNPNLVVAYHDYNRKSGCRRHWEDNDQWSILNRRSVARVRRLLDVDDMAGQKEDGVFDPGLGRYGLGFKRTLAGYQASSGLDFKARTWNGVPLSCSPSSKQHELA